MSAFRATGSLLKRVPESPHKYHYTEGHTPFWRKVRDLLSLNPEISSGLPLPLSNRYPQPASRPEKPSMVPSAASDPAANLYYHRDFRRKYPQTDVITQQYLTELLLASPNEDGTMSISDGSDSQTTALTRPSDLNSPTAFTEVLAQVQSEPQHTYSSSNMPPAFPSKKPQHILTLQKNAIPKGKDHYLPILLQRVNVVTAFITSVTSILLLAVSISSVSFPTPKCHIDVNSLDISHGDRRTQDFLETSMDLEMDISPLFTWNTKQVFLSVIGSYASPSRPENEVVFWDRILSSKRQSHVRLSNLRNKYGFRETSRTFQNITSVEFSVHWNVMPFVGIMRHGRTEFTAPVTLPEPAKVSAEKVRLLHY
ncbi:hypothetical protein MYAM1_003515 [Malassezia yamatoensis]|uniref:Signal peptidase complex subunit 3 n=1 Tax=Malassezia yamatoensis TaxID=253288 RepID=A0AAJ5Z066_9BASI|nr:hypothetical protein MYAM1_003515 [Malassezia yamatoensis]